MVSSGDFFQNWCVGPQIFIIGKGTLESTLAEFGGNNPQIHLDLNTSWDIKNNFLGSF